MFRKTAWLWGIIFLLGFGFSFSVNAGTKEGLIALELGAFETAFRELKTAAEAGDPEAQYNLGAMYEDTFWQPPNLPQGFSQHHLERTKQALKWYRLAAEQGYADAQNALGGMYYSGKRVPFLDEGAPPTRLRGNGRAARL
ncbi:MAG: sel1 repeat family protein [Proteobacteria bacterium]|nr:sel1 repeat family protein [Pseudomonadota bacterium]